MEVILDVLNGSDESIRDIDFVRMLIFNKFETVTDGWFGVLMRAWNS